ncbi:MAG: hypothetical protein ACMUJM_24445 [bacterium]
MGAKGMGLKERRHLRPYCAISGAGLVQGDAGFCRRLSLQAP